jgi:hypothetical protein
MIGNIFAASPTRPARIVITVPSGEIARVVLAALKACAEHAPVQVRGYLLGAILETGR